MRSLILLLFVAITSSTLAQQDSIYGYYDAQWKKLDDNEDATFFRVVKDRPNGNYLVRDYYISGKLQFVGTCTALEPKLDIEGEATLYHEGGGVEQIGHFKDEKPIGLHKYFYEHGGPRKFVFHREDEKDIYHQFWSRTLL
jgi:antitoxin component YwqK of YwqJK toxin-antitoxin module